MPQVKNVLRFCTNVVNSGFDVIMRILFVCSANICRSPLAETILRYKLAERGIAGVEVDSAGVHDYSGEPRDSMMVSYARKAGYELKGRSKYISKEILDLADYIICMEHFHVVEVQKRLPYVRWNRIHLFNEICFEERTGLPDPSGDTGYMYTYVLQRVDEGCGTIAWKISKMMNDGENLF